MLQKLYRHYAKLNKTSQKDNAEQATYVLGNSHQIQTPWPAWGSSGEKWELSIGKGVPIMLDERVLGS